jgi:hypothetical protein
VIAASSRAPLLGGIRTLRLFLDFHIAPSLVGLRPELLQQIVGEKPPSERIFPPSLMATPTMVGLLSLMGALHYK